MKDRTNNNLQEKSTCNPALHMCALEFRGLLRSARCCVCVRQREMNADKALGRGFLLRVSLCLTSPYWLLKSLLLSLPTTFSHKLGVFSFYHLSQYTIHCELRGRVKVWWGSGKVWFKLNGVQDANTIWSTPGFFILVSWLGMLAQIWRCSNYYKI